MFESKLQLLCEEHNIPLPNEFSICNRLKTSAGLFKVDTKKWPNGRITISKKYLDKNGYEATEKVLLHEFTHHYLWHKYSYLRDSVRWGKSAHTDEFKELCGKFGGTMNEQMAGNTYKYAACKDFVESEFKWRYVCTNCGAEIAKTKRAYSVKELNKYGCKYCGEPMNPNMKKDI